ncbi:MAG: acyl-ACP--UDP-N-acetylglucosamine O-acyltransferase [Gammaproteobacteria bacterium]|nr:acyl-ACP--UDP-N-acetylglucosamine O-acyltransferase [Gammaproteobacteria bacterium]
MIDPTARIDPRASLAADVSIGPWTVIEGEVSIGAGTSIDSHVVIKGPTRIGSNNRVHAFCSIGQDPQDRKYRADDRSELRIGDGNVIREFCTINRGTEHGGGLTRLGNDNLLMAYCHVAHDCQVGSDIVMANNATLGGHVEVRDHAMLGGFTGVHQYCRLGEYSMTSIAAMVVKDVPPFVIAQGTWARPRAINRVGLQRRGYDPRMIRVVRDAFATLYRRGLSLADALAQLQLVAQTEPFVALLVRFIRESRRGIIR